MHWNERVHKIAMTQRIEPLLRKKLQSRLSQCHLGARHGLDTSEIWVLISHFLR